MSSRLIYLVASTGYPNYGDELVAAQWLRYLARHEPDAEVWLDSPSPGNSQLLLGHLHPRVRFVDTLFRLCWAGPDDKPVHIAEFGAEAIRNPGLVPRFALGVELLHRADVFHILGGGYINAIWPRHLALLAGGSVLTERFDATAVITGSGLLPAAGPPELLDELTSTFRVVDVRDSPSAGLLSRDDATATGDDILLDFDNELLDGRESRSVMVAAQSDLVDGGVEALATSVKALLDDWQVTGEQIGYVEAMPGEDREVFERLDDERPGVRFYSFAEVWREGLPARRGQRWVTTRAAVHAVAALAQAWGVAIPVKAGYSDVEHAALQEQGSRWTTLDIGAAPTERHGEAGFSLSRSAELIAAKQAVADAVYG
jgi:hypothetical protein